MLIISSKNAFTVCITFLKYIFDRINPAYSGRYKLAKVIRLSCQSLFQKANILSLFVTVHGFRGSRFKSSG
jgi:hypothetical protein